MIKKTIKSKFEVIPLVIYPFDVCLSINQTDEELIKKMENQDLCGSEPLFNLPDTCLGRCVMLPSNLTVIRLKIEKHIPHGVIAHEIFHATTFIMDRIGTKLKLMVSDEPYAYLLNYLTDEIYNFLSP